MRTILPQRGSSSPMVASLKTQSWLKVPRLKSCAIGSISLINLPLRKDTDETNWPLGSLLLTTGRVGKKSWVSGCDFHRDGERLPLSSLTWEAQAIPNRQRLVFEPYAPALQT